VPHSSQESFLDYFDFKKRGICNRMFYLSFYNAVFGWFFTPNKYDHLGPTNARTSWLVPMKVLKRTHYQDQITCSKEWIPTRPTLVATYRCDPLPNISLSLYIYRYIYGDVEQTNNHPKWFVDWKIREWILEFIPRRRISFFHSLKELSSEISLV
jgi:hypothetical protein